MNKNKELKQSSLTQTEIFDFSFFLSTLPTNDQHGTEGYSKKDLKNKNDKHISFLKHTKSTV